MVCAELSLLLLSPESDDEYEMWPVVREDAAAERWLTPCSPSLSHSLLPIKAAATY